MDGVLDNTGNVLNLTASSIYNDMQFGLPGGFFSEGGFIQGGTVLAAGGAPRFNIAYLTDVTWRGAPLTVGAAGYVTLSGTTAIQSANGGTGTIEVTGAGAVLDLGFGTWSDTVIHLGAMGASAALASSSYGAVGGPSQWTLSNSTTVIADTAGAGTSVINGNLMNQGLIDQEDGAIALGAFLMTSGPGYNYFGAPTFDNQGTIIANAATSFAIGGLTTFSNEGLIRVGNGDDLSVQTSSFANTGSIDITGGGTLDVSGTIAGDLGIITLDSGTLFIDAPGSLTTTGTIANFGTGDAIIVGGATAEAYNAGILTFSNGVVLDFIGGMTPLTSAAGIVTVACFAAGTRIATPSGPRAVETIQAGDTVSLLGGRSAPVRWVGDRRIDCTRHNRPDRVWPVRIDAHAFGPGTPATALFLSPDHAVYCNDVLIPVRHLVNDTSIRQVKRDTVHYWHLELSRHDILLAEGLAVESYLDVNNRTGFAGATALTLHPDFASLKWEAEGCAPLVVHGPELDAARAALSASAPKRAIRAG